MKKTVLLVIVCCCFLFTLLLSGCKTEEHLESYSEENFIEKYCYISFSQYSSYEQPCQTVQNAEGETLTYDFRNGDSRDSLLLTGTMPIENGAKLPRDIRVPFSELFVFDNPTKHPSGCVRVSFWQKEEMGIYSSEPFRLVCNSGQYIYNFAGTAVFHSNSTIELYGDTTDVTVSIETKEAKWTVTGSGGLYAKVAVVDGEIETEGLTSYEVERE